MNLFPVEKEEEERNKNSDDQGGKNAAPLVKLFLCPQLRMVHLCMVPVHVVLVVERTMVA